MPCYRPALVILVMLAIIWPTESQAQASTKPRAFGVKVQAYPAGLIVAVQGSFAVGHKDAVRAFAAYNATDRRDFGEHDNEEGGGPGFGLAWRHYLAAGHQGIHFGARTDLWFLEIDWEDDAGPRAGTTDITVLQSAAQMGYTWTAAQDRLVLEGTVALGAEINVRTQGEPVGEGAILLVGFGVTYRL